MYRKNGTYELQNTLLLKSYSADCGSRSAFPGNRLSQGNTPCFVFIREIKSKDWPDNKRHCIKGIFLNGFSLSHKTFHE